MHCKSCHLEKKEHQFYRKNLCKECRNKKRRSKQYTEKLELAEKKLKKCCKCEKILSFCEFHKNSRRKLGVGTYCKRCSREIKKDRKMEISEYNRQYGRSHKNERNARDRERYRTDENYKIEKCLRANLYTAVKKDKGERGSSFLELLGCDVESLKKHIESLWEDGMSWENHSLHGYTTNVCAPGCLSMIC